MVPFFGYKPVYHYCQPILNCLYQVIPSTYPKLDRTYCVFNFQTLVLIIVLVLHRVKYLTEHFLSGKNTHVCPVKYWRGQMTAQSQTIMAILH